ncbi:hypothetical protein [Cellulophaga sp. L1A9]|uniref:hypothetical protein n=1 Tax=Cellulophaga sp. L1A9 TaxID=2686362 RepID=UPI00131A6E59|nr:hypothetical protein [Cellulophaga sp. L1A9]
MINKYLVSILAVFTLLITACSDDNDNPVIATNASFVGIWNLTAVETNNGTSTYSLDGESIVTEFEAVGKDFDATVLFSENPNTIISEGSYTTVLTTNTLGETNTEEQEGENYFDASEWRAEGNTLYFGSGDEEVSFTITSLTDTKINLSFEMNTTQDFFGADIHTVATYYMTLTK